MKKIYTGKTGAEVVSGSEKGKKKLLFPPDIKYRTVTFRASPTVALTLEKMARKNNTSVMAVASAIFEDVIGDYEI